MATRRRQDTSPDSNSRTSCNRISPGCPTTGQVAPPVRPAAPANIQVAGRFVMSTTNPAVAKEVASNPRQALRQSVGDLHQQRRPTRSACCTRRVRSSRGPGERRAPGRQLPGDFPAAPVRAASSTRHTCWPSTRLARRSSSSKLGDVRVGYGPGPSDARPLRDKHAPWGNQGHRVSVSRSTLTCVSVVEVSGLEPPTSTLRTWRSTS